LSIKRKILLLFISSFTIIVGIFIIATSVNGNNINLLAKKNIDIFEKSGKDDVEEELFNLSEYVAQYINTLEENVDKNMLNAAYVIQEKDLHNELDGNDLQKLNEQLGTHNFYITDENGMFVGGTDKDAIGNMNLFTDIWDGYRALLTGEKEVMTTDFIMGADSDKVYKFVAIPRLGKKGVLETCFKGTDVGQAVSKFTSNTKGFKSTYLISAGSNIALTETLNEGVESKFKVGEEIESQKIIKKLETNKPIIDYSENEAIIYYPMKSDNKIKYVLVINIDTNSYFENVTTVETMFNELQEKITSNSIVSMIVILIMVVIVIISALLFVRYMLKPLDKLIIAMDEVSHGELGTTIKIKCKGEFALLIEKFNLMTNALREMSSKIKESTLHLNDTSKLITNAVDVADRTNNDIVKSIDEIASGANSQAEESIMTLDRTNELANTINSINSMMTYLDTRVKTMSDKNEMGAESLESLESKFNENNKMTENIYSKVSLLADKTKSIGFIVEAIDSISEETNLLALNAAIEAVKAGEHGKSFAVVADEVRKLAESSSKSTFKIQDIIKEIISIVTQVNVTMEEMQNSVNESNKSLIQTKNVFKEIDIAANDVVLEIQKLINNIKTVEKSKDRVLSSIENISSVAEESAASTEEINISTVEQRNSFGDMKKSIHTVNNLISKLTELVEQYKL